MPVTQFGRRHFLIGTGAVMSIPFLPSLFPRTAHAQASNLSFFVAFQTMHGGVWPEHMWPSDNVLTNTHPLYSDHLMRYGRLSGGSSLARVLTSNVLPQSLVDKMMLIRGLDVALYISHNYGGALGNFDSDRSGKNVPTIDQVLAHWDGFYAPNDAYSMRSMHVGDKMSWVQRSSGAEPVDPTSSPDTLFRTVLSAANPYEPPPGEPPPPEPPTGSEPRTHVLNRVVEHYNKLANGAFGDAKRLSANDKARLNDHMDLVSDLAKRLDAAPTYQKAGGAACDPSSGNTGSTEDSMYAARPYSELRQWHQDFNAVFAAAIACGASRIATVRVRNTFHQSTSFWNDSDQWHEPVAHRAGWSRDRWSSQGDGGVHPQDSLIAGKTNFYRDVYVDMIQRMDGIDAGDGESLLDKGLVMWAQESGPQTHYSDSIPVITAGSVGGYFNTGRYFDFRNRQAPTLPRGDKGNDELQAQRVAGVLYNQWLSNVLQAMGMSPSEFQQSHPDGWAGYGHASIEFPEHHPSRLVSDANNKLPKVVSGT